MNATPSHRGAMNLPSRIASLALLVVTGSPSFASDEPTNREEAAAVERAAAAEEAKIDADYEKLVASLPAEERAWEKVLQSELGSFYLPIHKRQKVRGQSNAWDFVRDEPDLPRVLLIGDSVSRGYTRAVRAAMEGEANVHRAPANCGPTATGLRKLDVWLGEGDWDVIHFNFGIHDRRTDPADYEQRLGEIVARLKSAGDEVIWASTTPIPEDWKEGPEMAAAIEARNDIAARVMEKHDVATNDLFALIIPHLAEVQNPADVHFNAKGYELLGRRVAESIREVLEK